MDTSSSPDRNAPGPDSPLRYHVSGDSLQRALDAFYREDEELAIQLLNELLRLDPNNLRALYFTTLCAHLLTREEALEDACSRALELNPRHPYALGCEAVRYLYLANFSRSEALFEQALRVLPAALELHIGVGILHEYSGEPDKGIAAYHRAVEIDPDNVRARVALGGFLAMEGEFVAAFAEYRRARLIEPGLENPHQKLGRDYYHSGMIREAAAEFSQTSCEEPGEPTAWFFLLDCARRLGQADEALDIYTEIKTRFGEEPELTSGLFEHFSMRTDAVSALRQLAGRKPEDAGILIRLSRAYRAAGRVTEAINAAERAARLGPNDFTPFVLLGEMYLETEDFEKAVRNCRRAIELNINAQSAYTIQADALLFLGRQEESYAAIQEVERVRQEAWKRYQAKFSGRDRADSDI